jgi:hypothetical protein
VEVACIEDVIGGFAVQANPSAISFSPNPLVTETPPSGDSSEGMNHGPYPVPRESVALTDLGALQGKRITEVMRWEQDEWEMFAGAGPDIPEVERRVVPLGILLAADPSLLPTVDLRVGTGFWRDAQSEWHPWGNPEKQNERDKM